MHFFGQKRSLHTISKAAAAIVFAWLLATAPMFGADIPTLTDAKQTAALRETLGAKSAALGVFFGAECGIDLVVRDYPDLSKEASSALLAFESKFKVAKQRLETDLDRAMRQAGRPDFLSVLKHGAQEKIADFQFDSREDAAAFVEQMKRYAKLEDIPEHAKKAILDAQYQDHPAEEMAAGFVQRCSSRGKRKALGVDFHVDYPQSWTEVEGIRPHVMCSLQSFDRSTIVSIAVADLVEAAKRNPDLPPDQKREAAKAFSTKSGCAEFRDEMIKDTDSFFDADSGIMSNAREKTVKKITLDGWPGILFSCVGEGSRVDTTVTCFQQNFCVFYKGKQINLGVVMLKAVGETESEFQKRIRWVSQSAMLMANSFVINDQY